MTTQYSLFIVKCAETATLDVFMLTQYYGVF